MDNSFNLVDEAWIPAETGSAYSLRAVFSGTATRGLGGNPMEKVAIIKLLQAIAQGAHTPEDADAWRELGPEGLGKAALVYLERWREAFWLYGDKPFLQMPAIRQAEKKPLGALLPHIATGNNTVLQDLQKAQPMDDAARARLVLALCGYALGGKRVDNSICLTPGYSGKGRSGKTGPWLGFLGYLHHFLHADDLLRLVWLNMLTHEDLETLPEIAGVGSPPWEGMPEGEDCPQARVLHDSLMGRLIPLSRFMLLAEDSMHYSEGIAYPGYAEGWRDPSVASNFSGKKNRVLWADPGKLPWRNLESLLAFMGQEQGMDAFGLTCAMQRAIRVENSLGLWVGGVRVSSNAGEQYISGTDDFVESRYTLPVEKISTSWYTCLKLEMEYLTHLGKVLYASVKSYASEMQAEETAVPAAATARFWERCNQEAQTLLDVCDTDGMEHLRTQYRFFVEDAYNSVCPRETARQLAAWGKCRPRMTARHGRM